MAEHLMLDFESGRSGQRCKTRSTRLKIMFLRRSSVTTFINMREIQMLQNFPTRWDTTKHSFFLVTLFFVKPNQSVTKKEMFGSVPPGTGIQKPDLCIGYLLFLKRFSKILNLTLARSPVSN